MAWGLLLPPGRTSLYCFRKNTGFFRSFHTTILISWWKNTPCPTPKHLLLFYQTSSPTKASGLPILLLVCSYFYIKLRPFFYFFFPVIRPARNRPEFGNQPFKIMNPFRPLVVKP